jgi:hypothetical protein
LAAVCEEFNDHQQAAFSVVKSLTTEQHRIGAGHVTSRYVAAAEAGIAGRW